MAGEDIEDELGAVDDAAGQRVLEVAQLRGAEIVIETAMSAWVEAAIAGQLLHFSAANESGGIGFGAMLDDVTAR